MTHENALVSIVVPIYGTERFLPTCIASLCEQSYHNVEIILVDDESPDNCPAICDHYARLDSRITVIHQKNKGVSGARNTGIKYANGEYIMFVDSDDELYSDAVEILTNDIQRFKADIVSASVKTIHINGKVVNGCADGTYEYIRDDESTCLSLSGNPNTIAVFAKLFSAEFIREIEFEERKNLNEDSFFLFQCYLNKPILIQHNVLVYQYNSRLQSSSRQIFSDKYLSMLYFCERKKELVAKYFPHFIHLCYNMEVRTNLFFLDVLCRTTEKKYNELQRQCVKTVRKLYKYHRPINEHHKMLAKIVKYGLYPLYKWAVRLKYYR